MRILIAGLGAIGQRHARNLRDSVRRRRSSCWRIRRRRLPHVVTEYACSATTRATSKSSSASTRFADLDEALAPRPDAVFVCTPSSQHLDIAQRAADAGCHLFIEKPVSHTLRRTRASCATPSPRKDCVALVGCQWRFHPCVRWLRDLLAGGDAGTLIEAEIDYAEYLPDWHPYEDYRTSYAARAELGGGVVLTQIHDYDLAWWLFGPAAAGDGDRRSPERSRDRRGGHGRRAARRRRRAGPRPPELRDAAAAAHDHRDRRQRDSVTIDLLAARADVTIG